MWWKKSRDGSGQNPDGKPTVHFTTFGGRYVNADELLGSEKVREQIRSMKDLFRNDATRDGSEGSGRRDPRPDRPASCSP